MIPIARMNLDLDLASCATHPFPDLWFMDSVKDQHRQREAIRICNACPIREACASEAIKAREQYGVFGGLTPEQRRRINRRADRAKLRERLRGVV